MLKLDDSKCHDEIACTEDVCDKERGCLKRITSKAHEFCDQVHAEDDCSTDVCLPANRKRLNVLKCNAQCCKDNECSEKDCPPCMWPGRAGSASPSRWTT